MATVTEKTRYTPEDLLKITDRPMPELIDGELVEREPMGAEFDGIAAMILGLLWSYVTPRKLGRLHGSQGGYQIFPGDPGKVRIPDVSFTRIDRLPPGGPPKGHNRVPPDLVVEVISPNDQAEDVLAKIDDYQLAGIPLIWVVNPRNRTIRPYLLSGAGPALHVGDTLEGNEVLPGFSCPVAAVFE